MPETAPVITEAPPAETAPAATPVESTPPPAGEVVDTPKHVVVELADGTPDPGWELVSEGPQSVVVTKKGESGIRTTSEIPIEQYRRLNSEPLAADLAPEAFPVASKVETAPGTVSVKRTSGELEAGWIVQGQREHYVRVIKPDGDGHTLEKDVPIDDFKALNPEFKLPTDEVKTATAAPEPDPKQETYVAETTADAAAADWERIYAEAKKYFELFKSTDEANQTKIIDQIVKLRGYLAKKAEETRTAMEAGINSLGHQDNPELAAAVAEHTDQAVNDVVSAEIPGLVEKAVPLTDPNRRAQKQADKSRQRLSEMITMQQADFDKLVEDWKLYNRDQKHAEALAEQKDVKVSVKRQEARAEMAELRQKYGSSIDQVANLSLSKEPGGPADQAIQAYKEGIKTIGAADSPVAKGLRNINLAGAITKLQSHLSEKYLAEGLDETEIQRRLEESKLVLKDWLANSGPDDQPLQDLQKFSNARNKEQLWNGQRQKVREFLGTTLLARGVKSALAMEQSQPPPNVNIAEVLARGVDHDGSRAKAGAEAIRNPERVGSYVGRVMVQLETARDLGRHEGLMKIPIYLTALENSLSDGFVSAWEAIPDEKKKQARKKMMLGMAITSRSLRRLYTRARAKAAQKASQNQPAPPPGEGPHYG